MKRTSVIIFLFILALSQQGCYYDVQEELHPGGSVLNCDTSQANYSSDISLILRDNCISCHSQNVPSGNVKLDNYNGVKIVADNGKLTGSIDHLPGYRPMPQNLPQLSECDRLTIKKWIQDGSANN